MQMLRKAAQRATSITVAVLLLTFILRALKFIYQYFERHVLRKTQNARWRWRGEDMKNYLFTAGKSRNSDKIVPLNTRKNMLAYHLHPRFGFHLDCIGIDDKKSSRHETNFHAHHVELAFFFCRPVPDDFIARVMWKALAVSRRRGGTVLSVTCHLPGN